MQPIELISVQDGKFVPNLSGLKKISGIEEPIGIISIVGLYRTGKSFLMNQLMQQKDGFQVAHTIRPCTKGLWCWGPISVKNKHNQHFRVLFIDSEGIGSFGANETHDAQIFALSLLLSSFFIYNSLGNIDDNAIQRLGVVTQLSRYITKNKSMRTVEEKYEKTFKSSDMFSRGLFPMFVWVVRDFVLQLKDDELRNMSPDDYLELALRGDNDLGEKMSAKNEIKKALREYFPRRFCRTLVRPISDEKKLQNISKVSKNEFRVKFKTQINDLRKFVFDNVVPKTFNGNFLNGRMFVTLLSSYCDSLNSGRIVIDSCWENVIKTECNHAFIECKRFYKNEIMAFISEGNIVDLEKFEDVHREIEELTLKKFRAKSIGDEKVLYERELRKVMVKEYVKFKDGLKNSSHKFCVQIINENLAKMETKINSSSYKTYLEFENDLNLLIQKYKIEAKGNEKNNVLLTTMIKWFLPSIRAIHQFLLGNCKREQEDGAQEREREVKITIEELKREHQIERESLESRIRNRDEEIERQKKENEHLEHERVNLLKQQRERDDNIAKLNALVSKSDQENRFLVKEKDELDRDLQKSLKFLQEMKGNMMKLKAEKDEHENQIYSSKMEHDSLTIENSSLKQTIEFLDDKNGQLTKNVTEYCNELTELKFKYEDVANKLSKYEMEQSKFEKERERTSKEQAEVTKKLNFFMEKYKGVQNTNRILESQLSQKSHEIVKNRQLMSKLKRETDIERVRIQKEEGELMSKFQQKERIFGAHKLKVLEKQVEQLNSTNRRILQINKKVMEENKVLRDELISCGGNLRTAFFLRHTPDKMFGRKMRKEEKKKTEPKISNDDDADMTSFETKSELNDVENKFDIKRFLFHPKNQNEEDRPVSLRHLAKLKKRKQKGNQGSFM